MKKYIIMFLVSFILQDNIQCVDYKADLNKAIQVQLISARKVIGNVKLSLDLDVILDALVSYAKRGNDQSIEAINKMKDIETALQKYRSDQYTFWINTTILLGYDHPKLVKDSIDPAIKRVQNALKTLQANATSLGYKVAASAAAAAIVAITAWVLSQPKTDPLDAHVGDVYKDVDEAKLDNLAKEIATNAMVKVGFKDDSNRTYYNYAYEYIKGRLLSDGNDISEYSSGSYEYNHLVEDAVFVLKAYESLQV